ncbi:hypothetical protein GWI33_010105 [Rhynchophorus ferrugineus]|uniref:Thioredoxin-like fold domain-containing protein n=1 Tax=Rhynchophorus ferrugineus TaxID=354439 RepID=A0A834MFL2_RHYFE|nr:hypothetical protein GWI33_010105 [Rhynchophorus ferrugineus]
MQKLLGTLVLGLFINTASFADQATLEKKPESTISRTQCESYRDNTSEKYLRNFQKKENLTEKREQALNAIDISKLPLQNAIKQVKGNGKRVIYVFSDPDCPYCKRLEQELTSVNNITIYTFMYPLTSLHPNADLIAKKIWCSDNRYEAWEDYLLHGKQPDAGTTCENPIEQNLQLGQQLEISGTPTFFLQNGQRISGGRDADKIEELLNNAL